MTAEVTPFVLVHGFGDTTATWTPLLGHLGPIAVSHCWELPGHGRRAMAGVGPKTRDEAVTELADWIATLGRPVTLVGHSLGGYLSLMVAIDRPELISSLVLISSGPGFRKADARTAWNAYIDSVGAKTGMTATTTVMAHQPDSYVIDNLATIDSPLVHIIGARDTRYRAGADHLHKVLPRSTLIEVAGAGHHPQSSHPVEVAAAIHHEDGSAR